MTESKMALKNPLLLAFGLLLMAPFFFLGGPEFESPRSINELYNTGHIVFFALLAVALYSHWLPAAFSGREKIVYSFIIIAVLGVGIEVLQTQTDRRAVGWDDVARDIVGGAFVLFWQMGANGRTTLKRTCWRLMAITIVAVACIPLWLVLADEHRARKEFPVLSRFERPAELGRWKGSGSLQLTENPVRQGRYSAELRFGNGNQSGIFLFYCPQDWRGMKALAFSVHNPGAPLELHFRILDHVVSGAKEKKHHQYNDSTILAGGWNDISISMETIKNRSDGQAMDFAHIWAFGLLVGDLQENRILYLDDVRLLQ